MDRFAIYRTIDVCSGFYPDSVRGNLLVPLARRD